MWYRMYGAVFNPTSRFFDIRDSTTRQIQTAFIETPAKAICSLVELQLTSDLVNQKNICHASNFLDDDSEAIVPIHGLIRIDATPMPHAYHVSGCTIISFQILGYISHFLNFLLSFITLGIIGAND
eukprot:95102_1